VAAVRTPIPSGCLSGLEMKRRHEPFLASGYPLRMPPAGKHVGGPPRR
jgi:hypothetical protein